jgi:transcriptional regulator with XRE-family HTH domain
MRQYIGMVVDPPRPRRGRPRNAGFREPTNYIAAMREKRGKSQEWLAQQLGIADASTISKYELGKIPLTVETLLRIADVLECDRWDLLPGPRAYLLSPRDAQRIERFHELSEAEQRIVDRGLGLPDNQGDPKEG